MKNIYTGLDYTAEAERTLSQKLQAYPPTREQKLAEGYRDPVPQPDLADGYTRVSATWGEGDGIRGSWTVVDRLTAELDAEAVAAESERRNTPIIYDQPIETPVIVLTSTPGGLGIAQVAGDDGSIETFTYHASPVPSPAEIAIRKAAALQSGTDHRARITAIQVDLDQVATALDAIDVTATGALGVAIAATTGANKTALTAVRTTLQDFKAAVKNLRQASEKIRKEIK